VDELEWRKSSAVFQVVEGQVGNALGWRKLVTYVEVVRKIEDSVLSMGDDKEKD
jgi:hypothetical protein